MRSIISLLKDILLKILELLGIINKKTEIELAWTNPNPTSAFAAQTIALDLSDCDMVEIFSYGRAGQASYTYGYKSDSFLIGECGNIQRTCFIGSSIDYILVESRPLKVSKTGITFEKGSTIYMNANTHSFGVTSNGSAVPYKIFKIKLGGVLTNLISHLRRRWAVC